MKRRFVLLCFNLLLCDQSFSGTAYINNKTELAYDNKIKQHDKFLEIIKEFDVQELKREIANGLDIKLFSSNPNPIHYAITNISENHQLNDILEVLQILLDNGFDINTQEKDKRTIDCVIDQENWYFMPEITKFLLEHGADPFCARKPKEYNHFLWACNLRGDRKKIKLAWDRFQKDREDYIAQILDKMPISLANLVCQHLNETTQEHEEKINKKKRLTKKSVSF